MNSLLISDVEFRMPRYSYERFGNSCDVIETFPSLSDKQRQNILKTSLDLNTLERFELNQPIEDPWLIKLKDVTETRIQRSAPKSTQCYLRQCTPWLSKEKPQSADKSQKNPLKGKIYASILTRNKVKDDLLVFQETETCMGYMPPVFSAKATVAFPPICKGEVWTVGWIQALKKADRTFLYSQDYM